MFERFTDRARRVLVLAQEEARLLNHSFIGTEHLLLGLLHEGDGIAARVLNQQQITLVAAREKIEVSIGPSDGPSIGSPPFTPRAKKVLELSLREALQLGHHYIGTEHILLGILREGEGVGARTLVEMGATLDATRDVVLTLLSGLPPEDPAFPPPSTRSGRRLLLGPRRWGQVAVGTLRPGAPNACSFCGRQPPESGQLFAGAGASICEHCVRQWSERLEADEDPGGE